MGKPENKQHKTGREIEREMVKRMKMRKEGKRRKMRKEKSAESWRGLLLHSGLRSKLEKTDPQQYHFFIICLLGKIHAVAVLLSVCMLYASASASASPYNTATLPLLPLSLFSNIFARFPTNFGLFKPPLNNQGIPFVPFQLFLF